MFSFIRSTFSLYEHDLSFFIDLVGELPYMFEQSIRYSTKRNTLKKVHLPRIGQGPKFLVPKKDKYLNFSQDGHTVLVPLIDRRVKVDPS